MSPRVETKRFAFAISSKLRNDMMFWQIFARVILKIIVFPKVFANIQYVQMCMAGEKARGCLKEFSVFAKNLIIFVNTEESFDFRENLNDQTIFAKNVNLPKTNFLKFCSSGAAFFFS
jgi:hypothetical protein